ncbi:MAG: hypothetical protein IJR42_00760 [Paludibacteraceae bacterium]|nr:hypothetical protein [Paludibacteraceae bacterium]
MERCLSVAKLQQIFHIRKKKRKKFGGVAPKRRQQGKSGRWNTKKKSGIKSRINRRNSPKQPSPKVNTHRRYTPTGGKHKGTPAACLPTEGTNNRKTNSPPEVNTTTEGKQPATPRMGYTRIEPEAGGAARLDIPA